VRIFLLFAVWCFALSASAIDAGEVRVTARLVPEGLRVSYRLDREVTRFAFAGSDVARDGSFEVLTPALRLADDAVTSVRPFR